MGDILKINWKKLIVFILVTFIIGGFFSFFINSRGFYNSLEKPPLSPPGVLFPIVWSILYVLMGISLYLVSESNSTNKEQSYLIYIVQLVVNSLWTLLFFGFGLQFVSFLWILLLIVLVVIMIINFYKANKLAGLLQIPYLLWLLFAAYLNLAIFIINS